MASSIDAEAHHPSIQFKLVRKSSAPLHEEELNKVEDCPDIIKLGMSSTPVSFKDKNYECDGDKDPEQKGLTIGGYESAWLADLVGAHVLANTQQHFQQTKHHRLHRDDGFAIFKGQWKCNGISKWREEFQESANQLAGGDYPQLIHL